MAKLAVVLGCSTGTGAAIAKQLALEGYDIIGFHRGRHVEEAAAVEKECNIWQTTKFYELSVGDFDGVCNGVNLIRHGQEVDVLVHSLAGSPVGEAVTMQPKYVEKTFNVLANSFLYWCQMINIYSMFAPDARVIALTNPCPEFYLRNSGVIGAAKAALEAYVRILAAELGPKGIRVNAIKFSTVLTPALQKVLSPEAVEKLTELHKHIVPAGRMQTAEDVARFVGSFVGPMGEWANGAVIDLTGGAPGMLMDYAFNGGR